jgi:clan AA aspartic protease
LTPPEGHAYDKRVGTFSVAIQVAYADRQRWEWVEALVDTGSSYTWIPSPILAQLGIGPTRRFPFVLADGRHIEGDMAEVRVQYGGTEITTIVVFGDEGTQPLLGAYTLEGLGVAPDPVNQRLIEVPGLLM